jgi:hypothetical protein
MIHLGEDGIVFLQSSTAQILEKWRGVKGLKKSSSSLFQIEGIGEVKIVLVDEVGGRVSYVVSRESIGEEEKVKLKRLSAMSTNFYPSVSSYHL